MGWWDYAKWIFPAVGAADEAARAVYRLGDNAVQGKDLIMGDGKGTDATAGVLGGSAVDHALGPNMGSGSVGAGPGYAPPAGLDTTQSDSARNEMMQFVSALKEQAAGRGPSAAQDQLRSATDANIRQAMALGQSQRGVGYQAGIKNMLANQARTQQESALQSSFLRNQESMQAQSQLGGVLGTMRQGDLGQQASSTDVEKLKQNWAVAKLDDAGRKRAADNQLAGSVINAAGAAGAQYASSGKGKAAGGLIQGTPQAPGDSPRNDTVPAMLSPGEIVIPRTVAQSVDAPDRAAEFVAAIKASKGAKAAPAKGDYGALMTKQRQLAAQMAQIQAQLAGHA
jgi:hypothetical protein